MSDSIHVRRSALRFAERHGSVTPVESGSVYPTGTRGCGTPTVCGAAGRSEAQGKAGTSFPQAVGGGVWGACGRLGVSFVANAAR